MLPLPPISCHSILSLQFPILFLKFPAILSLLSPPPFLSSYPPLPPPPRYSFPPISCHSCTWVVSTSHSCGICHALSFWSQFYSRGVASFCNHNGGLHTWLVFGRRQDETMAEPKINNVVWRELKFSFTPKPLRESWGSSMNRDHDRGSVVLCGELFYRKRLPLPCCVSFVELPNTESL